jgi:IQ calmodulin-binding motif
MQAGARGMAARSDARQRRRTHAATVVQSALRMHLARQRYLQTRRAIIAIQAGYRGRAARKYTKDIRRAPSVCSHRNGSQQRCHMSGAWVLSGWQRGCQQGC